MLRWFTLPESRLMLLGLALETPWELAQFLLYTVPGTGTPLQVLYSLLHCIAGDLLILLLACELVALVRRDRYWPFRRRWFDVPAFTALGMAYTVCSEIVNTRLLDSWGYTAQMPVIPGLQIGLTPILQWLLLPPFLIRLLRTTLSRPSV